ncbi:hypothetical protein, partial [Klebsiella pneumoniae]
ARLRAAGEAAKRDAASAVKLYDEVIADNTVGAPEKDLARIRAGALLVDTTAYDALLPKLEPATSATSTYRHSARELLALAAWKAGNAAETRK